MTPTRKSTRRRKSSKSSKRRNRRWGCRMAAVLLLLVVGATALPIALLRWVPPPTTAFMWASRTDDPATGRPCRSLAYRWAPWSAISIQVPRAVLIAEDQRFLQHRGFDTQAIRGAVGDFVAGGRLRGASTISQQVAKNLFLWPERSALRKGLEVWLTTWIELLWPKRRIVEMYVNVAQFGPCVFGVEAASHRYFGAPPSRVSAEQAARLAAVLPAPGRMRVDDPGPFAIERAAEILAVLDVPGGPSFLRGL